MIEGTVGNNGHTAEKFQPDDEFHNHIWGISHEENAPDNPDTRKRADAQRCLEAILVEMDAFSSVFKKQFKPNDLQRIFEKCKAEMVAKSKRDIIFNEEDVMRAAVTEVGWLTISRSLPGVSEIQKPHLDRRINTLTNTVQLLGIVTYPLVESKPVQHATPLTSLSTQVRSPNSKQ